MKFIQPNAEIWEQKFPDSSSKNFQEEYIQYMCEHIEKCGRVCYKSEDHIKEGSAKDFVQRMLDSEHYAMLEHGTVYLKTINFIVGNLYHVNPYSKVIFDGLYYYITTNFRVIIENNLEDDLQYVCLPTEKHIKRNTICFTTDIGVTREFNRHRVDSIAEESTRYCNYTKGKFGSEITYTIPAWINEEDIPKELFKSDEWNAIEYWMNCLAICEDTYNNLIRLGWKPQQARQVLPLNTKSTLIHTAFETDWEHFFDLRVHGVTGAPHPNAKYVANIAYEKTQK
jgi:thymidylate synthase (FAD)